MFDFRWICICFFLWYVWLLFLPQACQPWNSLENWHIATAVHLGFRFRARGSVSKIWPVSKGTALKLLETASQNVLKMLKTAAGITPISKWTWWRWLCWAKGWGWQLGRLKQFLFSLSPVRFFPCWLQSGKKKRKRPVGDYDDDDTPPLDVPMPAMFLVSHTWNFLVKSSSSNLDLFRPPNPSKYGQLFTWASRLLERFELLDLTFGGMSCSGMSCFHLLKQCWFRAFFGREEVKGKLQAARFCLDSFFTGADFPSVALDQINAAVLRRHFDQEVFWMWFLF